MTRICDYCHHELTIKGCLSKRFCNNICSAKYFSEKRIGTTLNKFYEGKLTDTQVRTKTVKKEILKLQDSKCKSCGIENLWNGKELMFVLDHIDGNWRNNSPSNVRLICPNCNSQTDTFGVKNKGINDNQTT